MPRRPRALPDRVAHLEQLFRNLRTGAGVPGETGATGSPGADGVGKAAYDWTNNATLVRVGFGQRKYADRDGTILYVRAERSAGDGSGAATFDVTKNGVSIFPSATKPTIPASSFLGTERVPDDVDFVKGDYFQIHTETTGNGTGPVVVTIFFQEV
jgi:hypothetical protein